MTEVVDLPELARLWCHRLPSPFLSQLAAALRSGGSALRELDSRVVQPESRAAVRRCLRLSGHGDDAFLAGLITAYLQADQQQPRVTPVWTGPASAAGDDRLTLAVLTDLIAEARRELILASYAAFPGADLRQALEEAVCRGVQLTLLLERSCDNPRFDGGNDPLPGLAATRLCWPQSARPDQAAMHAKLLIIDRRVALVGSANLTGYAMERNLECGLLVRGGPVPGRLAEHLLSTTGLQRL